MRLSLPCVALCAIGCAPATDEALVEAGDGIAFENAVHRTDVTFTAGGVHIAAPGAPLLDLRSARIGCTGTLFDFSMVAPARSGERVQFVRSAAGAEILEWYEDGPGGLEQGFALSAPLPCRAAGGKDVVLEVALGGDLEPSIDTRGGAVTLEDADGAGAYRISALRAFDAHGRRLPARFAPAGRGVQIRVDDEGATYPLRIDPIVVPLQGKLGPPSPAASNQFGRALSVSGHTAVVGAPGRGAAHVFMDAGGAWTRKAALVPSVPSPAFGAAVAIWGNTALVGAPSDAASGSAGKVHVFLRVEGTWTEQAVLAPADGQPGDAFGVAVALSGDVAVVGAPGATQGAGAAYVFMRHQRAWTQVATLAAAGGSSGDAFGSAVAAWGDALVVGAPGASGATPGSGAAYAFVRTAAGYAQEAKITPANGASQDAFGKAIARWEDRAVMGAPGRGAQGGAYVFTRGPAGVWSQEAELAPQGGGVAHFGTSVAIAPDVALVGAERAPGNGHGNPSTGTVYLYGQDAQGWSFRKKLVGDDPSGDDDYGMAVALNERVALVGAAQDGALGPGAGATYAYGLPVGAAGLTLACSSATTLNALITCIRDQMPEADSEGFVVPTASEQSDLRTVVAKMLQGYCNFTLPASLAAPMRLIPFVDGYDRRTYCVLMEVQDADRDGYVDRGWGTFIVNPRASRELSHQASHPIVDSTTETEAVDVFAGTDARSFLMCGARRDANSAASACQPSYGQADCAHATANMYYPAVLEISAFYGARDHTEIQWHGMASSTCTSVSAYVSHGLSSAPPAGAKALTLKQSAEKDHPDWKIGVPGSGTCSLNATDNVEGRYLNGVAGASVCSVAAASSSGKFLHIEQHAGVRDAGSWIEPVDETFPIPLPAPPTSLTATAGSARVTLAWAASNGASGYTIRRGTTSGGPYTIVASGVVTTGFVDTAVMGRKTYYYRVTATNPLGESSLSAQVSAAPY